MKITNNFTLEEFITSATAKSKGIDNTPSEKVKRNIEKLVKTLMQPIRDEWGDSIIISSGYRCPKLNYSVGGSKTSQHMYGSACDFSAKDKKKNHDLFNLIKKMLDDGKIECRQLIWEYGTKQNPNWIHISVQDDAHAYRKNQILYLGV